MTKYTGATLIKDFRTPEQKIMFADYDYMMEKLMRRKEYEYLSNL